VYQAVVRALAENDHDVLTVHLVESGVAEKEAGISPKVATQRHMDQGVLSYLVQNE